MTGKPFAEFPNFVPFEGLFVGTVERNRVGGQVGRLAGTVDHLALAFS